MQPTQSSGGVTHVRRGASPPVELAPGVSVEIQISGHVGARGITTCAVTFEPGAALPYHTHPFTESVTVVDGELQVEVEGRIYLLSRLDNVFIPPNTAHRSTGAGRGATRVHVAMATSEMARTLVEDRFVVTDLRHADRSAGAELLHRRRPSASLEWGHGLGFGMVGGYSELAADTRSSFGSGGDTSVTIIAGGTDNVHEGDALLVRGGQRADVAPRSGPVEVIWFSAT